MRLRFASPDRAIPTKKFSTVGVGDTVNHGQSTSKYSPYTANGVHYSKHEITSGAKNKILKQDSVTQITTSKASYSANRDLLGDDNSSRNVASKKRVRFASTTKDTSANSVYCSGTNEQVGLQKANKLMEEGRKTPHKVVAHNINERSKSTINNTPANRVYVDSKITTINSMNNNNNTLYGRAIQDTIAKLSVMFPEQVTSNRVNKLVEIAIEGYKLADNVYTAKDAEEWGNSYEVPNALVQSDEALFKASMRDINVMAARRQKKLIGNRLNVSRVVLHTRADNPERNKLLLLAEKGMPLLQREGFKANGQGILPPLRKTYTSVKSAVNRLLVENFHELGLAFILKKSTALTIPDIHFSPLHWTEKQGKRQGRPIGDCSDGGSELGNEPLNSLETKEQSDLLWGNIRHPSIDDVANMIMDYYEGAVKANANFDWDDIEIFTKDLKGAFTLLFFDAEDVQHLAMEMTDEKVIIFICGIFGWTGTPAAFQVVNRAIVHELKYALQGLALMYSDDVLVVTEKSAALKDMTATDRVCSDLMGPNSVEKTKSKSGRRLTFIGYDIDLDKRLITISERNIKRTLYGFLSVDLQAPMKVKTMQKLASWASRYGKICIYMKPFVSVLYAEYAGRNDHTSFLLSVKACQVIRFFRVLLGLIAVNSIEFARPLKSFRQSRSSIVIELDASLTGIGLLYYERSDTGEVLIAGGAIDISTLKFESEASFQNTAEFIAAVLGIRGLSQLGQQPESVCLRGDSMTALTWASTGRFKGELVCNAAAVFVLQNVYRKVAVNEIVHLAAENNWRADYLSRGGTMEGLLKRDSALRMPKIVELNGDELVELCDPTRVTTTEKGFNDFWFDMRRIIGTNN